MMTWQVPIIASVTGIISSSLTHWHHINHHINDVLTPLTSYNYKRNSYETTIRFQADKVTEFTSI
jgi:hypothetical protein